MFGALVGSLPYMNFHFRRNLHLVRTYMGYFVTVHAVRCLFDKLHGMLRKFVVKLLLYALGKMPDYAIEELHN